MAKSPVKKQKLVTENELGEIASKQSRYLKNILGASVADTNGFVSSPSSLIENSELDERGKAIEFAYRAGDPDPESLYNSAAYSGVNGYLSSTGTGGSHSADRVLFNSTPTEKSAQLQRAEFYYEQDDLLNKLVDIKQTFTCLGFSLQVKPAADYQSADQSEVTNFQTTINQVSFNADFKKIIEDLVLHYIVYDSAILYWRTQPPTDLDENGKTSDGVTVDTTEFTGIPGIYELAALNPPSIDWNNSLGQDILSIKIPISLQNQIKEAFRIRDGKKVDKTKVKQSLVESGIQSKWIDAVQAGKDVVVLRKEDGDYWFIKTKARKNDGLARPSMRTIFATLEARRMLVDGDYSTAFVMKHFILLLKQGESIRTGPQTGSRKNWMTQPQSESLMKAFATVNKAGKVAANHTTTVDFIYPPAEMFSNDKFKSVDNRVFNWSDVSVVVTSGEGSDYSGGYISIKRLLAVIEKLRDIMNFMTMKFFHHETIRDQLDTPEGFMVGATFDQNVLKEPRQVLEEVRFMFEQCISDARTAARELGRDPDQLKSSTLQTRKENEDLGVWEGVGPQGIERQEQTRKDGTEGGPEGRPANPGTERTENTRMQRPIARQTVNS